MATDAQIAAMRKEEEDKIKNSSRRGRKNLPEGLCKLCDDPSYPVPHFGSTFCQSRGLAAEGGTRAHCTCDSCF